MIPAPDFRIQIAIDVSEEVIRMGCGVLGFAIACWAMIKIIGVIAKSNEQKEVE